jgi:predicted transcriptional regulator
VVKLLLSGIEIIFLSSPLGAMPQITLASEASSTEPANLIVEMLENIGVSTNVAYVLVSLHEGGNLSSKELQLASGLRQPEISVAMKELLNEEMVRCEAQNEGGRGRPSHRYCLNGGLFAVINPFIIDAELRLNKLTVDLERLNKVSQTLTSAATS